MCKSRGQGKEASEERLTENFFSELGGTRLSSENEGKAVGVRGLIKP